MPVSIPVEISFFLYSLFYGAVCFFAYDILRCFRRVFIHNTFWIAVEDLAFWMVAGILLFLMVFEQNSGSYRVSLGLGVFCGIFLWYFLFDHWIVAGLTWIFKTVKNIIWKVFSFFGKPVRFFGTRSLWTANYVRKKMKKASGVLVKHLKKYGKLIRISGKK